MEPNDNLLDREMISVQARTSALHSNRWAVDKEVSVVEFFEIDLFPGMYSSQHPESTPILDLNMTRSLYKKVWVYFFPSKQRDTYLATTASGNSGGGGSGGGVTDMLARGGATPTSRTPRSLSSASLANAAGREGVTAAALTPVATGVVAAGAGVGGHIFHTSSSGGGGGRRVGGGGGFGRRNSMSTSAQSTFINPVRNSRNDRSNKIKFFYFKAAKIGAIRVELSARGFPIKVDGWKLKLDSFGFTSVLKTSSSVAESLKHNYIKLLMKAAGKLAFGGKLNRRAANVPSQLLSKKMILDTRRSAPKSKQWKCVRGGFLRVGPRLQKCQDRQAHELRPGHIFTEIDRIDERKQ